MQTTTLHIKNMVCSRCVMSVEQILDGMNLSFSEVTLGTVVVNAKKNNIDTKLFENKLNKVGFELLKNENDKITEEIKALIINYIHHNNDYNLKVNFSDYISSKLYTSYSKIAKVFSATAGITIEKYLIKQKIELVKELISYKENNFSEIAFLLNYSSVAHLSKQFKRITGLTLSQYRDSDNKNRISLSEV